MNQTLYTDRGAEIDAFLSSIAPAKKEAPQAESPWDKVKRVARECHAAAGTPCWLDEI